MCRKLAKLFKKGQSVTQIKAVAHKFIEILKTSKLTKPKILIIMRYLSDVLYIGRKKLNFDRIQCGEC